MRRGKSILGIAVLCAIAFSAFAVASASAEERAAKCVKLANPEGTWKDAHCKDMHAEDKGEYGTTIYGTGTKVAITGSNAATADNEEGPTKASRASKLHGTLAGVETEVQCTGLTGTGEMTNAAASVTGNGTIEYTGCTVLKPAGRECVVTGGTVTTKKLSATTVGQAATKLKFSPFEGTQFASVPISNCKENIPPTASYPVTGTLVADTSGATTTTTAAGTTTLNTLKFGGNKAGIDGALTIKDSEGNPVTLME